MLELVYILEMRDTMNYFTSDLHFGDDSTVKFDMRPFKNSKVFDKFVINTWNKQANKDDVIYVIGDFVDCDKDSLDDSWKRTLLYVKKVKAKVVLITGNNEDRVIKRYFDNDINKFREYCINLGFLDVAKSKVIKINNQDFYLVHKPCEANKEMMNLFGHMHRSGGLYKPFGINIGCDLNHFRLFSEKDIEFFMKLKKDHWDNDKNLNMW